MVQGEREREKKINKKMLQEENCVEVECKGIFNQLNCKYKIFEIM